MKVSILLVLTILILNLNLNGQTRTIIGRVISEDLESLPMLDIRDSNSLLLGKTDMDGRFKITIPQETDSLLFRYLGMEWTDIRLKKECDTVEVVMMYDVIYDFMTSRKIDKLRKNRFDNLPTLHSNAVKNGLFYHDMVCYDRAFEAYKPDLDRIGKELKKKGKANKHCRLPIFSTVLNYKILSLFKASWPKWSVAERRPRSFAFLFLYITGLGSIQKTV
jgi:hypothetical protein